MLSHRSFRLFLLTLILTLLTPGSWAESPPAAESKESKKLTVMLDWFVNPDHAALVVAQQKGFFAAQNLEVELQTPADPNDPDRDGTDGSTHSDHPDGDCAHRPADPFIKQELESLLHSLLMDFIGIVQTDKSEQNLNRVSRDAIGRAIHK